MTCLCRMMVLNTCLQVKAVLSYCPVHLNSISHLGKDYICIYIHLRYVDSGVLNGTKSQMK